MSSSFTGSVHGAQFMGLVNALRTGDPALDLLAAILLPVILQKILKEGPRLLEKLFKSRRKDDTKLYTRVITYRTSTNSNGVANAVDNDENFHLLRAVKLYVHRHRDSHLDDAAMELTNKSSSLQSNQQQHLCNRNNGTNSMVDTLRECTLVERPLPGQWITVGTYDGAPLQMMLNDSMAGSESKQRSNNNHDAEEGSGSSGGGGESKNNNVRSMEVRLRTTASVETINRFVKTAHDWYVQELQQLENNDRYMFDINVHSRAGRSDGSYTAYTLGHDKTFDTLFSRECHSLRKIVDQFESKTGKYSVPGYPWKLGILLSGPPGTGKTSLIKALASYTGRHIVNINLSRVRSNAEIMTSVFRQAYQVTSPIQQTLKLDFRQVIFVLEDVDASSEVVMDRKLLEERRKQEQRVTIREEAPSPAATANTPAANLLRRSAPVSTFETDRLNLTGLLNVLDGVVETPGRIVILTTNHPEMLDPALTRPGRIDKQLVLGYMLAEDVIAMVQHYYQTVLNDKQQRRIVGVIDEGGLKVTPAQIEQFAMEKDLVADFIMALEQRHNDTMTTAPNSSGSSSIDEEETNTTALPAPVVHGPFGSPISEYGYVEEDDDYGDY